MQRFLILVLAAISLPALSACDPLAFGGSLRTGAYDCVAVFVNETGKYELYVDDAGREFTGFARVQDGEVTSYSAPNALGWRSGADIAVRSAGRKHFHATQDPAVHSYDALACDWSGE